MCISFFVNTSASVRHALLSIILVTTEHVFVMCELVPVVFCENNVTTWAQQHTHITLKMVQL